MGKLLIILFAFGLLLWLARSRNPPPSDRPRIPPPEGMVACAHCGVHLPRSEALVLQEQAYCSPSHRDAGPRKT